MRTLVIGNIVGLLSGFVATSALAQVPAGWAKVETVGFTMALPKDWYEFEVKKPNLKQPWLGTYRYVSKNAHGKLFIRISQLKPGPFKAAVERNLSWLRKKVHDLKQISRQIFPVDASKTEMAMTVLQGILPALDPVTKQDLPFAHLIVRIFQRHPRMGLNAAFTYMFAGNRMDQAQAFVEKHMDTFQLNDPKEIRQQLQVELKSDPKKK